MTVLTDLQKCVFIWCKACNISISDESKSARTLSKFHIFARNFDQNLGVRMLTMKVVMMIVGMRMMSVVVMAMVMIDLVTGDSAQR